MNASLDKYFGIRLAIEQVNVRFETGWSIVTTAHDIVALIDMVRSQLKVADSLHNKLRSWTNFNDKLLFGN